MDNRRDAYNGHMGQDRNNPEGRRPRPEGFSNRRARTVVSEFDMYLETPLYFEYLKAVR